MFPSELLMEAEVLAALGEVQVLPQLSLGQPEVHRYLEESTFGFVGSANT